MGHSSSCNIPERTDIGQSAEPIPGHRSDDWHADQSFPGLQKGSEILRKCAIIQYPLCLHCSNKPSPPLCPPILPPPTADSRQSSSLLVHRSHHLFA